MLYNLWWLWILDFLTLSWYHYCGSYDVKFIFMRLTILMIFPFKHFSYKKVKILISDRKNFSGAFLDQSRLVRVKLSYRHFWVHPEPYFWRFWRFMIGFLRFLSFFFTFLLSSMGREAPRCPPGPPGASHTHPNTPRSGVQGGLGFEGGHVPKWTYHSSTLSWRDLSVLDLVWSELNYGMSIFGAMLSHIFDVFDVLR